MLHELVIIRVQNVNNKNDSNLQNEILCSLATEIIISDKMQSSSKLISFPKTADRITNTSN